jgi:hypothetical protein
LWAYSGTTMKAATIRLRLDPWPGDYESALQIDEFDQSRAPRLTLPLKAIFGRVFRGGWNHQGVGTTHPVPFGLQAPMKSALFSETGQLVPLQAGGAAVWPYAVLGTG